MAGKKRTAAGEHLHSAELGLERAVNGLGYARAALQVTTLPWARAGIYNTIESMERDVRVMLLKLRQETEGLTSLYVQSPPKSRRRSR